MSELIEVDLEYYGAVSKNGPRAKAKCKARITATTDTFNRRGNMTTTKEQVIEQLFADICHLAHKHEVQYWLDAPGNDAEKLSGILRLARDGLAVIRSYTVEVSDELKGTP